jgi:AGCS family alanine or glycine:cation symporter
MDTTKLSEIVNAIDGFVWGPVMLILLVGTGIFLSARLKFLPQRNLGYALSKVLSKEARNKKSGDGDVSPFSALMTALASTIGTGNIVGVATAMFSGGPGALVWMWISAFFGLSTKFGECMLSGKYREQNARGEMSGGPMYTMKNGIKNKTLGKVMGFAFALFTVLASFGIGNVAQANSISNSLNQTFGFSIGVVGVVMAVVILAIALGGIKSISKISTLVVPFMALFYVACAIIVILGNFKNIPHGLYIIFTMAFNPKAIGGGVLGAITVTVMNSIRYGVSRGVFSNEAGLGSAAITAAAAKSNDPVGQAYINMTGTFFDTIVVCTLTGVAIASSGVLGTYGADGLPLQGIQITIAAFSTILGPVGAYAVSIGIVLFAFSTILGWEYNGEKGWEYLFGTHKYNNIYRVVFAVVVYFGATQSLDLVWSLSDIANALMAIPNLVSMIILSNVIVDEVKRFQVEIDNEREQKKAAAGEKLFAADDNL